MTTEQCTRVCEGCPLRAIAANGPIIITETESVVPVNVSPDGFTFEIKRGGEIPNWDQRTAIVTISGSEGMLAQPINVPGRTVDDGSLLEPFDNCPGPVPRRCGFLWLKRGIGCAALGSIGQ